MMEFLSSPASIRSDLPFGFWLHLLVFSIGIIALLLTSVIIFIWFERRLVGRFQLRLGPNRAGPIGIFQSVADVIKILTKEDIIPTRADKLLFWLAPIISFSPVVVTLAVVPVAGGALLADLNVGILFIMAMSSIISVGVFTAGFASYNKYSLLSSMRVVAQLVSYEIPLILSLVGVVMLTGSLSLDDMVNAQTIPFILLQPVGFFIFFIASLAEISRSPFDLLEADSELVAGYNIEYSGMKFATFYLTEYCEAIVLSAITATVFLGGWQGPWLPPIIWLLLKVGLVFSVIVWIRATLPRLRVDQVMGFAWKFLLPLAVLNILITGLFITLWPEAPAWINGSANLLLLVMYVLIRSRFFRPGGTAVGAS
ncbi:MAG: NADH-quinone oxidoreductase subunit NuoH [Dehalococcoidales bacterium]|nr:NADH-quinone oxidoreductase subunit NuoH [Dehalococcoidales bacterium]